MTSRLEMIIGRCLLALLFLAGAVQKAVDPSAAQMLLAGFGLPEILIWPAMIFNAIAGALLIAGKYLKPLGRMLAAYCLVTSVFHFVPADPWQMSIFIKNIAIAGGCLFLSVASDRRA